MKVLIINDQKKVRSELSKMLATFDCVGSIDQHANPYDGLVAAKKNKPDVVFLNIEMSALNGLAVAEHLKSELPEIGIVFVTEHRHYAVQAFEINAVDYLTRPLTYERLENTFKRLKHQLSIRKKQEVIINCFGALSFATEKENKLIDVRWRTRKTEELFAYLVFYHNEKMRKDLLVDLFWPHINWQRGISQLYSAIYQIRQTMQKFDFDIEIESTDQYYVLHLNGFETDVKLWEEQIDSLPEINEKTLSLHIQTIYQYQGDLFGDYQYSWIQKERNRIRETWLYHIQQISSYLLKKDKYIQTINIYHHVQDVYPTGEDAFFMLMKLYAYMNNYQAVELQYKALQQMLRKELGTKPRKEIREWYDHWRNNRVIYLESIHKGLSN